MAFDLMVGKSNKVKDNPTIVGSIEFDEYPTICSLAKKININFLHQLTNLFDDQTYCIDQLVEANKVLLSFLSQDVSVKERILLHKLISVVGFALFKNESLFGVAD